MTYKVEPYVEIDHKLYLDQAEVDTYAEEDEALHQARLLLSNTENLVQRVFVWRCIFDEQVGD